MRNRLIPWVFTAAVVLAVQLTALATAGSASAEQAPATTVSLTFDDGTADEAQAGPILAEHSMAGTFFVISGRVGAAGYLSLADLNALAAAGNEIGDHTVSHLNLLGISADEAARQVCNARVQLMSWGFHVWDFAYPQGGTNPQLEQIVRDCNLNSARVASNLVSPGTCFGCPYAETLPPRDPFAIATPDSVKSTNTLQDLKNYVTQAQAHGGGWVPIVFHHVCDGCNVESVSPEVLSAFLDWLALERANGVTVRTVHEVVGGEELPPVSGPLPASPAGELIHNPSLEADGDGNGVPDCWTVGGSGSNVWDAGITPDAHEGERAERVSISSFTSGDRRLVTSQDLGGCAPPVTAGDTYTASAYVKGQGSMRWVAYYRDGQGAWTYWAQSGPLAAGASFARASWTTPSVPAAATALSVGVSLRSVGAFTLDDLRLGDDGPSDVTPPTVSLTSPETAATVGGPAVYVKADAGDDVGVVSVRFFLDGAFLGSKNAPVVAGGSTYQWKWDATAAPSGSHVLTATALDAAGNQTPSQPVAVTVSQDTLPPSTTILCNGSATCQAWYRAPVTVTLKATDNVGVARTYFTTDGSEPSATNGAVYSTPFAVAQTATVRYRSVDAAGNLEPTASRLLQVDAVPPAVQIASPAGGSTVSGPAVYILAAATDDTAVASVRYFVDGVSLGSKVVPTVAGGSTYQWKWDTGGVVKGPHTLTAVATDSAGNQTASPAVTITVG